MYIIIIVIICVFALMTIITIALARSAKNRDKIEMPKNETFIIDTNDTATAKNVWRFDKTGLSYSENGIKGPFMMAIAADPKYIDRKELEKNEKVDIAKEQIPQWDNYTIAVDFDKTLCDSKFPECGPPITRMVNYIKEAKMAGCKIILWTCRVGEDLEAAVRWCRMYGIPLDAVNENLPEHIKHFGNETRKVYANLYIDDRGINPNINQLPTIKTKEKTTWKKNI